MTLLCVGAGARALWAEGAPAPRDSRSARMQQKRPLLPRDEGTTRPLPFPPPPDSTSRDARVTVPVSTPSLSGAREPLILKCSFCPAG